MTEPVVVNAESNPFQLRAIYLRESQTKLDENFDPLKPGQRLTGQFKSSTENYTVTYDQVADDKAPIARACEFLTRFEFIVYLAEDGVEPKPDMSNLKVAATITTCLAVDYLLLPGEKEPSREFLERYGRSAAIVHKWPYWREFCHSAMTRMHLPLMMVPLLSVIPKPSSEVKTKIRAKPKPKAKSKIASKR